MDVVINEEPAEIVTTADVDAAAAAASAQIAAEAAEAAIAMAHVAAAQVNAAAAAEITEVHQEQEQQEDRLELCQMEISGLKQTIETMQANQARLDETILSIQAKLDSAPVVEVVEQTPLETGLVEPAVAVVPQAAPTRKRIRLL